MTFFVIFDSYLTDQLLFESSMGNKSVDSIIRAQTVALSDAGLSQVQISRQLSISRHCEQNDTMKLLNIMTCNEQAVHKKFEIMTFDI